ncbi:Zinc finger protein, partial [Actinidia chinensis var. chinensis]
MDQAKALKATPHRRRVLRFMPHHARPRRRRRRGNQPEFRISAVLQVQRVQQGLLILPSPRRPQSQPPETCRRRRPLLRLRRYRTQPERPGPRVLHLPQVVPHWASPRRPQAPPLRRRQRRLRRQQQRRHLFGRRRIEPKPPRFRSEPPGDSGVPASTERRLWKEKSTSRRTRGGKSFTDEETASIVAVRFGFFTRLINFRLIVEFHLIYFFSLKYFAFVFRCLSVQGIILSLKHVLICLFIYSR